MGRLGRGGRGGVVHQSVLDSGARRFEPIIRECRPGGAPQVRRCPAEPDLGRSPGSRGSPGHDHALDRRPRASNAVHSSVVPLDTGIRAESNGHPAGQERALESLRDRSGRSLDNARVDPRRQADRHGRMSISSDRRPGNLRWMTDRDDSIRQEQVVQGPLLLARYGSATGQVEGDLDDGVRRRRPGGL